MPAFPRILIGWMLVLLVAGCQTHPPAGQPTAGAITEAAPPIAPPAAGDTCAANAYRWLVGESRTRIPVMPAGRVVRVTCSTCMRTLDFNAARLDIVYDTGTGIVLSVSCG